MRRDADDENFVQSFFEWQVGTEISKPKEQEVETTKQIVGSVYHYGYLMRCFLPFNQQTCFYQILTQLVLQELPETVA